MKRIGWIGEPEEYKGFITKFYKNVQGFYIVEIRDKYWYFIQVNTNEKTKEEARQVAHIYINDEIIYLRKECKKRSEEHLLSIFERNVK